MWFTDPPYGILSDREGYKAESELGDNYVFRLDPETGGLTIVTDEIEEPNGLAFSPRMTLEEAQFFVKVAHERRRHRHCRRNSRSKRETKRHHSRAQLPGGADPGPGGFRGRLAGSKLQGLRDRRGSYRLLRRALHGRDGEDHQPKQEGRHPGHGRRLLAFGLLPAGRSCRLSGSPSREKLLCHRLHQLQRRGEGAGGRDLHQRQRRQNRRERSENRPILFVPDQNLGSWVMEKTGRKMDLWQGNCYVHVEFTRNSIAAIRKEYPDAPVVAHPECTFAVRMLADEVCSTEKMVSYCKQSSSKSFIIVTESGMLHRLKKEVPGKTVHSRTDRSLRLQ